MPRFRKTAAVSVLDLEQYHFEAVAPGRAHTRDNQ